MRLVTLTTALLLVAACGPDPINDEFILLVDSSTAPAVNGEGVAFGLVTINVVPGGHELVDPGSADFNAESARLMAERVGAFLGRVMP